jgi:hypothetical protein
MERVDAMTFAKFLQVSDVIIYANTLWVVERVENGYVSLVNVEHQTSLSIASDVKVFKV